MMFGYPESSSFKKQAIEGSNCKVIVSTTTKRHKCSTCRSHPLEMITQATGRKIRHNLTSTFKPYKDCQVGKAKKSRLSKNIIECSKSLGKRLFFDIRIPSFPCFGGKKHWILVTEDSTLFLKMKNQN